MEKNEIKSVSEYIALLEKNAKKSSWLFRGHESPEFNLVPGVGRKQFNRDKNPIKNEKHLLEQFKKSVHFYLEHKPENEWEWLAVAQHYKLPTRFLDWSYNPLIALFFAVENYSETDSIVFMINMSDEVEVDKENPFEIQKVRRYTPPIFSNRIRGQSACFTVHPNPREEFKPTGMSQIIIPMRKRREIKQTLFKLDVRQRNVYPGLDGISKDITWLLTNDF